MTDDQEEDELKYNWAKIAHFLLEAFAAYDFKAGELRILQLICRETYGRTVSRRNPRKKQFCSLSQSHVAERVGIPESSVRRCIGSLVKHQVLLRLPPKGPTAPWQLGINTKIKEWGIKCEGVIYEREYPRRWEGKDEPAQGGSENDGGDHSGSPIPRMGDHSTAGSITADRMGDHSTTGGSAAIPCGVRAGASPKEPCIKEPLSLGPAERILERPKDPDPEPPPAEQTDEVRATAMDMFANFKKTWWPITGAPHSLLTDCQSYAISYRHELETAWEAFDEAFSNTLEWQETNDRRVATPGPQVLNRAVDILRKRGIQPQARARPPGLYAVDSAKDNRKETA